MKLTRVKFFFLALAIWSAAMILVSFYPWLIGAWQEYQRMNQPGPYWEPRRIESLFQFRLLCLHVVLQGVLSAAVFSRLKPRKPMQEIVWREQGLASLWLFVSAWRFWDLKTVASPTHGWAPWGLRFSILFPLAGYWEPFWAGSWWLAFTFALISASRVNDRIVEAIASLKQMVACSERWRQHLHHQSLFFTYN
jgi:hypothetical protein